MSTETIERTFNVAAPARLKVGNIRGSVDVQPGSDGVIEVTAVKHTNSGSNGQTQIVIEQTDDGTVLIESKFENSVVSWFGLNKPCKIDFIIRVPQKCSVKTGCVSSKASIQGLDGEFKFNSVSGALNLKELTGPVDFSSVSGRVTAEGLAGPLKMDSVSGTVRVTGSQIPSVTGKTVSGKVTLETPLTEGPYNFNSVSGQVTLITPEETGCNVSIKSISGSASTSLPITATSGNERSKTFVIQDGGAEVSVHSVSGRLRIVTSENGENARRVAAKPAESPPPPPSQMSILEKIESGEISVDEALGKLNV